MGRKRLKSVGPAQHGGHASGALYVLCSSDVERLQAACRRNHHLVRVTHVEGRPGARHPSCRPLVPLVSFYNCVMQREWRMVIRPIVVMTV
jgi:hypothetical protein